MSEQSFKNHGRYVPSYHFFALPVLGINFVWSLMRLRSLGFSFAGILECFLQPPWSWWLFERDCLHWPYRTA